MINFDSATLNTFVVENIDFLQGARVQKIQQPTRQDFVLGLRNEGETKKFYINIHPNFFHVCFMSAQNEQKRFIKIPQKPPMFCMLLRKYLEGAKIARVSAPENERILEFYFETYNEVSEKIYICLAIELMGKHSNVVLYNYDTNVIIGCAHNVGEDKSRERHLVGGLPYVYPLRRNNTGYYGTSMLFKDTPQKDGASINEMIDDYFASNQESEKIKSMTQKLSSFVGAKMKKVKNSLEKLNKQLDVKEKAEGYRKNGDLIMANLYANKDFSKFIEVFDYESNSNLKIDLDETKTLKENANRYYKLYNKAKTAVLKSQEFIDNLTEEKIYLEQVLYSIETAVSISDLLEIEEELGINNKEKEKKKKEIPSILLPFSPSIKIPFTIYVGKNNKQNDYIVSKVAKDEDWWFHVRLGGGSHVLLKVENNVEPDEKTIFECAKLAKEHSSAKLSSKVGIIYTKRKFLKKPPGAKLGYVIYKNEKEIIVD